MKHFFYRCIQTFFVLFAIFLLTQGASLAGGRSMIKTVELKGSYYEIGVGWGNAFQGEMDMVVQIELGIISKIIGTEIATVVELGKKYLPVVKEYDPDFVEVLKGFAKGAGIEFDTLFAIRTLLEVLFYSSRPEGMCTSFAVTGGATKDGLTIIGQNIDWHPDLPMALLRINWPNRVKQLSLSMGGIWEYSLSSHMLASPFGIVSTLTATPDEDPNSLTVPISIIMNKASRQKSLGQALSVFASIKANLGSFLLANGDGKTKGVELGLNGFEFLSPQKGILLHANHYISERYQARDIFIPYVPDSPLRYQRLKELVEQNYGKITHEHMMRYLSDHHNHPKGVCTHVDPESKLPPSATLASVIMVPKEKIMYVAIGNPCKNKYVRYKLEHE